MSLDDVVKIFEVAMPLAFSPPTTLGSGVLNGWSRKYGFLWKPYSLSGLESQLGKIFGNATLRDFNHLKCAAGATGGHPFMTSALRGAGGTFKSRHSKQP